MVKLIGLRNVKHIKVIPNPNLVNNLNESGELNNNTDDLMVEEKMELKTGNILYTAPELLQGSTKIGRVDVYS